MMWSSYDGSSCHPEKVVEIGEVLGMGVRGVSDVDTKNSPPMLSSDKNPKKREDDNMTPDPRRVCFS